MPVFPGEATPDPQVGLSTLGASWGDALGATARQTMADSPLSQIWHTREAQDAAQLEAPPADALDRIMAGANIEDAIQPVARELVPIDAARARIKAEGLDKALTHLPDEPAVTKDWLDLIITRGKERRQREDVIARGPKGVMPWLLSGGTSLLVGAIDPLNIAASFIPVVGEARWAQMLASAGSSVTRRALVRAELGAVGGAAFTAGFQPLEWYGHTQEGRDFSMAEALHNVIMGAGMFAGMHVVGGGASDLARSMRGHALYPHGAGDPQPRPAGPEEVRAAAEPPVPQRLPSDEVARPPDAQVSPQGADPVALAPEAAPQAIAAMPTEQTRADAMRASIAALTRGEPVRTAEMLEAAAAHPDRREGDFQELAQERPPSNEPAVLEASKAAESLSDPIALPPDKRLAAAEKALADADEQYNAMADYLTPEERQRIETAFSTAIQEDTDRQAIIRAGGACLAAAVM